MFHVQLQLVVLEQGQQIDDPKQVIHGRHLATAYIQHVSPDGQGRLIFNLQAGASCLRQEAQLAEGLFGHVEPLFAGGLNPDVPVRNQQPVSFWIHVADLLP